MGDLKEAWQRYSFIMLYSASEATVLEVGLVLQAASCKLQGGTALDVLISCGHGDCRYKVT